MLPRMFDDEVADPCRTAVDGGSKGVSDHSRAKARVSVTDNSATTVCDLVLVSKSCLGILPGLE